MPHRTARCHRDNMPGTHPQGSYVFSGTSNAGTAPYTLSTIEHGIGVSEFTWRGWVKAVTGANLNYGIFAWKNDGLAKANILYPKSFGGTNKPYVYFGSSPYPSANVQGTIGAWVHVVFTRSATGVCHWYFDGIDVTLAVETNTYDIADFEVIIGSADNAGSLNEVLITEVLVLSSEWSAGEVAIDYATRRLGSDESISGTKKAYFPLDGRDAAGDLGSGTSTIDNKDRGLREVIGVKASGTNGTNSTTSFDSASYADWSVLGIDAGEDVLVIISGTGVTPGVYTIASVASGALTLDNSPGAAGSDIVFSVERKLARWGAPQWVEDSPFPPPTADANGPYETCGSDPVELNGIATNYASVAWSTTGDGTFDDATALDAEYTPGPIDIANGSVSLTLVAHGNAGNEDESDKAILTIGVPPTPNAGTDQLIAPTETVQLAGDAGDGIDPVWTSDGDGTFDDDNSLTAIYTPGEADIENGGCILTLTVTADTPCSGDFTDSMVVTIVEPPPTPRHWSFRGYFLSYRMKGHS